MIIKEVFNKRVLRLITDGALGVVHIVDGLVDNLLVALSDFAADKQAKLSAASEPNLQGDAANAKFAGPTSASAAQSHPARADPPGSAAADDRMDEEELPPANANLVINGLECPPPSLLRSQRRRRTFQPIDDTIGITRRNLHAPAESQRNQRCFCRTSSTATSELTELC